MSHTSCKPKATVAYTQGYYHGLRNRKMQSPEKQPDRQEYRQGYVDGQRVRREGK